jgi:hypothetical protein
VTLLPVIDARRDQADAIDPQSEVIGPITADMKDKGYAVVVAPAFSEQLDAEELAELEPSEVVRLAPPGAQALMYVRVVDVFSRYVVMAYTGKADVEGIIVDTASGDVLWKDKGVISIGQGGLMSGLNAALSNPLRGAVMVMMQGMPKQGHVP